MKNSLPTNKFTVLITTYNRYEYLKRLLKFYNEYNNQFNILILDSSSDKIDDELKILITKKNIDYIKYSPSIFVFNKITDGSKFVKTPFVVICADDDFIIPSAINKCIDFLDKNTDYSSAQGVTYKHYINKVDGDIKFIFKKSIANTLSIYNNDPVKRLSSYCKDHTISNSFYAVQRSELFHKIWSESKKYTKDWAISEFFPCALSLLYGKMKVLPIFYASREADQSKWYDDDRLIKMFSDENCKLAVKGLVKQLNLISSIPSEVSQKKISKLLGIYRSHALKEKNMYFFIKKIIRVVSKFKNKFHKHNFAFQEISDIKKLYKSDYEKIQVSVLKSGDLKYLSTRTRAEYKNVN